jgi:tellurium resistance protein TerZ
MLEKNKQILIRQNLLQQPEKVNVGVNWSAIAQKKFFGLLPNWEDVNLDICVAIFNDQQDMVDLIYPAKILSSDGAVFHSGDDTTGDKKKNSDDDDNEVITIDFGKLSQNIQQLVFFLVSANRQDFAHIPYSKVRIYSGEAQKVQTLFGQYNISAQKEFAGKVAMVLGKLYKDSGNWSFKAIGEGLTSEKLLSTVSVIKEKFLI